MKELTSRRKQFDADFWRDNFELFFETLELNEEPIPTKLNSLKRRAKTSNPTTKKNENFSKEMNTIAQSVGDECWRHFLKRVRDNKYEISSKRKRISISEKHYSRLSRLSKRYGFESPNKLLDILVKELSDTDIKKLQRKIKK